MAEDIAGDGCLRTAAARCPGASLFSEIQLKDNMTSAEHIFEVDIRGNTTQDMVRDGYVRMAAAHDPGFIFLWNPTQEQMEYLSTLHLIRPVLTCLVQSMTLKSISLNLYQRE